MPDLKISQLPVASATTGAELFPVVQGGITKQIALNAVRHIGSAVFDANGSMAVDTSTLFVDAANDRVGIQTATPAYPLQVRRAGGAGSLGVSVDNAVSQRTVQYFAVGDNTTDTTAHAWYTRAGTATDVLRMSVDYLGNLTVDTNTLFVDAVNNRVGVGTATPTRALDVATSAMVNSSGVLTSGFYDGVGISGYDAIGWYGSSTLAIGGYRSSQWGAVELYTAGVKRVTVDGPGNLGLGVPPSAWASGFRAFQIAAGASVFGVTGDQDNLGVTANAVFDSTDARWEYIGSGFASLYQQDAGTHIWSTAPSGTAGNAISFTQAMTLNASGNLGVGTPSPANKLSVIGKIAASDSDFTAGAYVHGNPASGADRQIAQFSVAGASNGFQVNWNHASSKIHIIVSNIPTASAGLPAGTLWSDAGTIKIT
jgi:hypothetical protein